MAEQERNQIVALRNAVSALQLESIFLAESGMYLVTKRQLREVLAAASAFVPPAIWEDPSAPFDQESQP